MIRVLQYKKEKQEINSINIKDMTFQDFKWIDCVDPTLEEQEELKQITGLSNDDLERCLDEDERPSISPIKNYSLIIFKAPFKTNEYFETSSLAILISENLLITIRKKTMIEGINHVWKLDDEIKKTIFSKGPGYLLFKIIDRISDDYFKILEQIENRVEDINEEVFENSTSKTVKKIFEIRKTLVYFHRALSANRDVITNLNSETIKCFTDTDNNNIRYVYNDNVQLIDMVAVFREILTGSLDLYLSSVSNNMNKVMKKMTAFGSLVLVPTFITGLYGMNFKKMPELFWNYGYLFAWGLILISIISLIIYFKKKDWF